METQARSQNNKKKRNVKRAAYINYLLNIKGITQNDIAKELNMSQVAISRSFYGLSKISKVDIWLKENLGI